MTDTLALAAGLIAAVFYISGYQLKRRKSIIAFNITSKTLFVIQYLLLGATEGAVLNFLSIIVSLLAQKKDSSFIQKHLKGLILLSNTMLLAGGLFFFRNIFSLFSIAGILLQTGALWLTKERHIRCLSIAGCPFWLTYNLVSNAWVSSVCDTITMCSLALAIYRYDIKKTNL